MNANAIQEAQQTLRDILAETEDLLAEICVHPATIDIKIRRPLPLEKHFKRGTLHFDGQSLSYTEALTRCRVCRSSRRGPCPACLKRNPQRKPEAVDIQTISDTDTLCAIVNALPRMHQRLVEDSRVSPEDIMEAVAAARSFLDIRS